MMKIAYNQLSTEEKRLYERMERAFEDFSSSVDLRDIDSKISLQKVLQSALSDHPEVFYFDKRQLTELKWLFGMKKLIFSGTISSSRLKRMQIELEIELDRAVKEIELRNPVSDYEKLISIYHYLQDHVIYDITEYEACMGAESSKNPMSHNAYGVLVNKIGVCDGISSAFSLIAHKMKLESFSLIGTSMRQSIRSDSHAWNLVHVGGKFYHIDATFDICRKEELGEYSYEYFCLDDDSISKDHDWDITMSPPGNYEDLSYYFQNHCFANNLSQLEDIVLKQLNKNRNPIRVKISDRISIPEPEQNYLAEKILDIIADTGRRDIEIQFLWSSNTRCFYVKIDS